MYTKEELQSKINELGYWYHNIELMPDVWTNPAMGNYPTSRWDCVAPYVPDDLSGKSVLDLSCNSGYFAIQMKKRGASRVVGVDIRKRNILQATLAKEVLGVEIELIHDNVYNFLWRNSEEFDYIFFLGLFYHLRSPLFVLDRVALFVREKLFFQTFSAGNELIVEPPDDIPLKALSDPVIADQIFHSGYPKAFFIENKLNDDPTNWWFLNQSCIHSILRSSGFKSFIQVQQSPDLYICQAPEDRELVARYDDIW